MKSGNGIKLILGDDKISPYPKSRSASQSTVKEKNALLEAVFVLMKRKYDLFH